MRRARSRARASPIPPAAPVTIAVRMGRGYERHRGARWAGEQTPGGSVSDPQKRSGGPVIDGRQPVLGQSDPVRSLGQTAPMATGRERSELEVIAFLAFIGMSVAFGIDATLPAFDEMRPDVGLPPGSNRITLAVTVYFLGMAAGQVVYGPVADRFGRAPTLRIGMVIYALGATGSMLATDFEFLLASRLVWGLGASAATLMNLTILRDLYTGDRMARMMSTITAVFLVGPVVVPLIAEGILRTMSWRWVYAVGIVLAAAVTAWGIRFGETLDPANRRPLRVGPTIDAFRRVVTCRRTVLYASALLFADGAFLIFLGSTQQVFEVVYDRADEFAVLFAASAIGSFTGCPLTALGRAPRRVSRTHESAHAPHALILSIPYFSTLS